MPTYTVTLRTFDAFAQEEVEATTPAEALEKGKALPFDPGTQLEFFPYDGVGEVEEIEVEGANAEDCALWQSEECRLRYAANHMFEALKASHCPVWVHNAAITDDIEALRRIALWFADWSEQHRAPALKLVEEGGL